MVNGTVAADTFIGTGSFEDGRLGSSSGTGVWSLVDAKWPDDSLGWAFQWVKKEDVEGFPE